MYCIFKETNGKNNEGKIFFFSNLKVKMFVRQKMRLLTSDDLSGASWRGKKGDRTISLKNNPIHFLSKLKRNFYGKK
jgi:hypothetical protein